MKKLFLFLEKAILKKVEFNKNIEYYSSLSLLVIL